MLKPPSALRLFRPPPFSPPPFSPSALQPSAFQPLSSAARVGTGHTTRAVGISCRAASPCVRRACARGLLPRTAGRGLLRRLNLPCARVPVCAPAADQRGRGARVRRARQSPLARAAARGL
eukprot:5623843-Prymnesium_polylepis.1